MAEINGYLLTKEEEKACLDLIKKMREHKFTVSFFGCIKIKAETCKNAKEIFWNWVKSMQDNTMTEYGDTVIHFPYFKVTDIEEE